MAKPFYERLKTYYLQVGKVLKGEADKASIFPNPSDVGSSREKIYAEFLRRHLPTSSNVKFGGFLFGLNGAESKQIDIIITCQSSIQFDFLQRDTDEKSFACIEGCLGIVSVKSKLDKKELEDSLSSMASIPDKESLDGKINPLVTINNYSDWPFKIIYASDGISVDTVMQHLAEYYRVNPDIPVNKRPNLIHVGGKYVIAKVGEAGGSNRDGVKILPNTYYPMSETTDAWALNAAISGIQQNAVASQQIFYNYTSMIDQITF